MRLASPWLLALLLVVPPLVVLTVRRLRHLAPRRRLAFLLLRAASLALLATALASPTLARLTDRITVAFLLDMSHSVDPEDRRKALTVVEEVRGKMSPDDGAFLVRFGRTAEVEPLARGRGLDEEGGADIDGSATDIAAAIRLALAEWGRTGSGGALRIVLLGDGNPTRGGAESAAAEARALGARIFAVPLASAAAAGEVAVSEVAAPARVRAGEPHQVTVLVRSLARVRARVTLLRDGEPAGFREAALEQGENPFSFTGSFDGRGLHAWEAVVESPGDGILENNRGRRLVEVTGSPRILSVARAGRQSSSLLAALAAQGIEAVSLDPAALPSSLAGFLPYDAVILDNVPGFGLSYEKMEVLERYVRDTGGGLLMIGGENSFGAGGYYKTPLERALPVDMDVKSQVQMPRLAMVIVADKSGSMGASVGNGETKIDIVKSAALSAAELLNPFDRVGLLAFDADSEWTVPLTEAGNSPDIARRLAELVPGGGTILYPALEEAYRALAASPSPLRHMLVLSDGLTNPGGFEALADRIARDRITISAVAVGEGADAGLLADLARRGGGRFYVAGDPRSVPRIFMTETILVSRGLLIEKRFLPSVLSGSEILDGIPASALPPLDGFVLTYMKTGAERVLTALYDAPLLAAWQYGLGRSAAFTADLRGRWGKQWAGWDLLPRFSAQLVRWIGKPAGPEVLRPALAVEAGKGLLRVDAWDELARFVNGRDLQAVVVGPGGQRVELAVAQTGPGLYEAGFDAEAPGDYVVTVSDRTQGTDSPGPRTTGASRAYADEYRVLASDRQLLARLASRSGGSLAALADAGQIVDAVLARSPRGSWEAAASASASPSAAWPWLLGAALALFVLDIAVRKVLLSEALREKLGPLLDRLGRMLPRARPGSAPEEVAVVVARAREEEKKRLHERISLSAGAGKIDPDLAAYLYIARLRGRRAAEQGKQGD